MRKSAGPVLPATGGSHTFGPNVATPSCWGATTETGSGMSVAHSVSPSIARDRGIPSRSTSRITRVVSGSTVVSVPAIGFATQIAVGVTARSPTPGASCVAPTDSARPAPMRQSFPSPGVVTQAAFGPTAIDPTEPGSMAARRTIRPDRSSRRTTEPSTPSTQTPALTGCHRRRRDVPIGRRDRSCRRVGSDDREVRRDRPERVRPRPRDGCRRGSTSTLPSRARPTDVRSVRVVGSRRATAVATGPMNCVSGSGLPLATQTDPAPNAMSVGVAPVASVSMTLEEGTMRSTVRASASTSQSAPSPTASADGVRPAGMRRTTSPDSASMPTTVPSPATAVEPAASSSRRANAARATATSAEPIAVATSATQRLRRRRTGLSGARSASSWPRIAC